MKKSLLVLIVSISVISPFFVKAQNRNANVYFHTFDVGVNTKESKLLPQKATGTYDGLYYSGISDEQTGELKFFTTGNKVFKPDYSLFLNGIIDSSDYVLNPLIVPNPADSFKYYIFYTRGVDLYYATVDLRNGGVVTSKNNLLVSGIQRQCLTAVSYTHKKGWWIITHSIFGNEYYSFLVLTGGINKVPVKSTTSVYFETNDYASFSSTSHKGDKMVVSIVQEKMATTKKFLTSIVLGIDKRCGQIIEQKKLYIDSVQFSSLAPNWATFSPDDSKIYRMGAGRIVQFSGTNYKDSLSCFFYKPDIGGCAIFTGVDKSIYVVKYNSFESSYSIDKILNPDLLFPQCSIIPWYIIKRANTQINVSTPRQIMDQDYPHNLPGNIDFNFDNACKQLTVNFTVENDAIYDSLLWQFGDGVSTSTVRNTSFSFKDEGDYVVKLVGYICGQADTVSKVLRVREQPKPDLGNDTAVCYGSIVTLKSNTKADAYLWSDSTIFEQMSVTLAGKYWLQLAFGDCKRADTITVIQNPKIWTALGDEYFVCEDDKELIKLDAGEKFNQYKWAPTGDTTQWIIVGDVGDYFVVVKDFRGCAGSDGTQVKRRCPVSVYFPNIFTPNNDGLNDNYAPKGKDVVSFSMKIYNRWGQLVFETNDLSKTWNGFIKGEAANADVYVYTATYSGYMNKRLKEFSSSGSFTLLR